MLRSIASGLLLAVALSSCGPATAPAPKTTLIDAIVLRDAIAVQALLDAGVDVNAADDTGMTPLIAATTSGQPETIAKLLAAGADINAIGPGGATALIHAILAEQPDMALFLIEQPGIDLEVREEHGSTPLCEAVAFRSLPVAEALLDKGVDINAPGPVGRTALHIAAMQSNPELIQWLLDRGALATAVDESGATLLHHAVFYPLPREDPTSAEVDATIALLLKSGCNINAADAGGQTPLHMAILFAHPWIIEMLLDAGADPLAMSGQGLSPACYLTLGDQAPVRTREQALEITALFRAAGLTDESIIDSGGNNFKRIEDWIKTEK